MSLMVRPITVTPSIIVSSNVTEIYPLYTGALPTPSGERVYSAGLRKVFEALTNPSYIVTANASTDRISHAAHGLIANAQVRFQAGLGGVLPAPLVANTVYFVKTVVDADTYTLSTTSGGALLDITSNGSGTIRAYFSGTIYPLPTDGLTNANWGYVGPLNYDAMFDKDNQTKCEMLNNITYEIDLPSRCNAFGFLELEGVSRVAVGISTTGASRTNYILQSKTFDNASWSKTNITATANVAIANDATLSADKIEASGASATTFVQNLTAPLTSTFTYSIEIKKGSGTTDANKFRFRNQSTLTNLVDLSVNYDTGIVTQTAGTGATMTALYDGWWLLKMPIPAGITSGQFLNIYAGFIGDVETAGEYAYFNNAQVEPGIVATSRIPTTTVAVASTSYIDWKYMAVLDDNGFDDDAYSGTYDELFYKTRMAYSLLDPIPNANLLTNMYGPGTIKCGTMVIGLSKEIGKAQYGAEVGVDNFSTFPRDIYGKMVPVERWYSDTGSFAMLVDTLKTDALQDLYIKNRANPCLFLMKPEVNLYGGWKASSIMYAYPRKFKYRMTLPTGDLWSLDLEGV